MLVGWSLQERRSRLKGMQNIDGIRSSLGSPLDLDGDRQRDREQDIQTDRERARGKTVKSGGRKKRTSKRIKT